MGKYKFKARAFVGKTPNDHFDGWETSRTKITARQQLIAAQKYRFARIGKSLNTLRKGR
jgi:hypothetical protein